MRPIAAAPELRRWQVDAQARPDTAAQRTTDDLMHEADQAEMEALRARQAANRNAAYTRRRPSRYANASYQLLTPQQNPRGMVSTWYARGPRALLLAGPSRTGKTTAAYAIANDAHADGGWVMAWTAAGLSAALKPDGEALAYVYAATCGLLLIDDLGRERVTDWWLEQLQRIVDERCANERRLIITTNSAATSVGAYDELVSRYGDPLVERLVDDGGVIVLDGPPVRRMVNEW